jgi:hypothetical protein
MVGKMALGRWLLFFCALAGGLWAGFSASPVAYGAEASGTAFKALVPIVRRAEKVDLSPPLRSIQPLQAETHVTDRVTPREVPLGRRPIARSAAAATETLAPADPVVQNSVSALKTPAPTIAFEGISNADNVALTGFSILPPDTVGDVGPNHYVQLVNVLLKSSTRAARHCWGLSPSAPCSQASAGLCEAPTTAIR